MGLVASFVDLLQELSRVMTRPTFVSFVLVVTGWVFAHRRTVTGMILAAGAVRAKHHSAFHRVFAAARWSRDELGLAVFQLILKWQGDSIVMLGLDDTLARKGGRKIFGVGMHHDPLLSSRKTAVMNWGHSWVVLGVLVRLPCCPQRSFCLPILFRLYLNRQTATRQGWVYRTRPELAVEMLQMLCQRHEDGHFHVVADSTYGGQSVLKHLPANCELTSRLLLDARLYDLPPEREKGARGRPRKRGARLPSPRQMLAARRREVRMDLYGRRERSQVAECAACLYCLPERLLRVVAVQPLSGGRSQQAFYSTCGQASAEQVLSWYGMRWSMEQTFQESKGHLGFEEPQGWTRRAVERTAPTAMVVYSLIVLWFGVVGHREYCPPYRPWYRTKQAPSFSDMLSTLRRESIRGELFSGGLWGPGEQKWVQTLLHAYQDAA